MVRDPVDSTKVTDETEVQRVGRRTRRGIKWNLLGSGLSNLVRIAVVAILGRLLDSSDFGVVAAALSVLAVLNTVRDLGIGQAIIQRRELTDEHQATAFATITYLGLAIAGLLALTAPWIGALYHIPESVNVLRVLGILFALRGTSMLSLVMCQRNLNFRAIAIVDSTAYTTGSAVSIALAYAGAGAWSLVAGYLAETTISAALYLWLHPPPLSLRIHRRSLRELLGFGIGSSVMEIASVLANQGDYFVVGRVLGKAQLGFYTRAYELMRFPSSVFTSIVGNVLFPAMARLQHDRDALRASFRRTLFVNALLLLPAGVALQIIAPEAIRILLGPRWGEAVLPFRILSLTLLFRTSYKAGAIVARAAGDVYAVAIVVTIYAACVIGGAAATVGWGISGVAVSTSIAIVIAYVLLSYLGMRRTEMTWGAFIAAHVIGAVLAGLVAAACWPAAHALRTAGVNPVATAAAIAVLAGVVVVAGVALLPAHLDADLAWLRAEVGHIGARLRRRSSK